MDPLMLISEWNWVFCQVFCLILFIAGGIAVLVILLAGMKYLSSKSPEEVEGAKRRIFYAIIGLIIVIAAAPFVNYLVNAFTPQPGKFDCWCSTLSPISPGNGEVPVEVRIVFPGEGSVFEEGMLINFRGEVKGGIPKYGYEWVSEPEGVDREIRKSSREDTFSQILVEGEYEITLTATDDEGRGGEDSVRIKVISS